MIPMRIHFYVNPSIGRHQTLIRNIQRLLKQKLYSQCDLRVIDVIKEPKLAIEDQVYILPTLIRKYPVPEIRIIGDFEDMNQIINELNTRQHDDSSVPIAC